MNKLKSSSPKDAFYQSKVEIGVLVLEKKFLNICQCNFAISKYLPLERDGRLHLNKLESTSPNLLCAKFGWNWPTGSGEEEVNVKSWQQRGQIVIRKITWAFGSGELKKYIKLTLFTPKLTPLGVGCHEIYNISSPYPIDATNLIW